MTHRPKIPVLDAAACVICGPCRFSKLGLIEGRSCANGQDCANCVANRQISERCIELDPGFFERPVDQQIVGIRLVAADLMLRHTCNLCELLCPELAITADTHTGRRHIDPEHCKSCGLCAHFCPHQAIRME